MTLGTRFLGFLLAVAITVPASVSAQPNPSQPDMAMDASTRAEAIASLTKALRAAYVFPDVGDAVAKILEERNARGEYNSITSAKAFADLLTKQMSESAHDKHLGLGLQFGGASPFACFQIGRTTTFTFPWSRATSGTSQQLRFRESRAPQRERRLFEAQRL